MSGWNAPRGTNPTVLMRHHVDLSKALYFGFFSSCNHPHKQQGQNKKAGQTSSLWEWQWHSCCQRNKSRGNSEVCRHNRAVSTATTAVYTAVVNLHKGKVKTLFEQVEIDCLTLQPKGWLRRAIHSVSVLAVRMRTFNLCDLHVLWACVKERGWAREKEKWRSFQ